MKNISKLLQNYVKYQDKADNCLSEIEKECQKYSTMELHLFFQPSDGLCFSVDRIDTRGVTMNVPLIYFQEAVKGGKTLNEFDLNNLSV